MACGIEPWVHAHNSTDACPHPPVVNCNDCRAELCSAHIIECETCGHFICADCQPEHYKAHRRKEAELRRRN